jgi:hypothetical protein
MDSVALSLSGLAVLELSFQIASCCCERINFISSNQFESGDHHVDELDSDERNDDTAQAVNH